VLVEMISYTVFMPPKSVPFRPVLGASQMGSLAEFAGRACYASWSRPNKDTDTPESYVRTNLLGKGHLSVLEHGSVGFYLSGVSRSLTHELVRHRHFSYSQLSQRYVSMIDAERTTPPSLEGCPEQQRQLDQVWEHSQAVYISLAEYLHVECGTSRKEAFEAARAVLPNMTPTSIVVTGNLRSWLEFLLKRGSKYADKEIYALAVEVWQQLHRVCPEVFKNVVFDEAGNLALRLAS